ncbi:MAG TPA: PEP/pyruvate-binding domain-containing protein [Anaerolineales bacterium]|nr:PEP/pyruvate-binding domain-containing protein [Anaerolineales bacterium]
MTLLPASSDRALSIYLALVQYPILSTQIRSRMRRELFRRGVITPQGFEAEVRERAVRTQAMEGMHDPFAEEPTDVWETRLMHVRDHLTDFYFAYNLPYDLFEKIVLETLAERGANSEEMLVSFNPELAPQTMLFEQALAIEKLAPEQRAAADARLQEIKVVLIRTLISDQLAYLKIAKDWFNVADLIEIRNRKIGQGKIGGKAAGMLLAARILIEVGGEDIREHLRIPESYFIGADLTYSFMSMNGLLYWGDQKYKTEAQIRADYPQLQQEFIAGQLPQDVVERLGELLEEVKSKPLIVRSSSLLEDNFGTSFAGKYESHFCPNQGTPTQNLEDLTRAISSIYASILNPDALLYRRARGLQDYDERMAILIQVVEGQQSGRYFLPHAAGVAFSRNLYRWSPQIRREDGFMRLVWGLGTRAVDRVGNDYPRLVALSHPLLHPEASTKAIRRYSQRYVDVIDMEANAFKTLPVGEVLGSHYPPLRYLVQVDQGGYLVQLRTVLMEARLEDVVLTFDGLLRRTAFSERMAHMLRVLEHHYHAPVDTEFTVEIKDPHTLNPDVQITLLQCRPQSQLQESRAELPVALREQDIIFSTRRLAPEGMVDKIRTVIFISPEGYFALPSHAERAALSQAISRLNASLVGVNFICVGPGRWGTSTPDLGVNLGYGDIYNARALIELAGEGIGPAPEASFGTHFFQDLVESNIYPLAIYLDDEDAVFNRDFFYDTPNRLTELLPDFEHLTSCLRVIEVASYRPRHHLNLVMDAEKGRSVAFVVPD